MYRRNHIVRVLLTCEEKDNVGDLAYKHGLSVAAYIRLALKEYAIFHNNIRDIKSKVDIISKNKPKIIQEEDKLKPYIPEWIVKLQEIIKETKREQA